MATTQSFIDYVSGQLAGTGEISSKRMFGEAMIYIDAKPILLVCDDSVFVKKLPCIENLMTSRKVETGTPYPGAKPHWRLDADDAGTLRAAVAALLPVVPVPAKKKTKKKNE